MAMPDLRLAPKKKKPTDGLDDIVDARMPMTPEKPASAKGAPLETSKRPPQTQAIMSAGAKTSAPIAESIAKGSRPATPADPMDALVDERAAAAAEIDASNAKQQMDARSRAGLGGLGLSGGAQAGAGDLARQQARTKALTMADFDRMVEDRAFTDVQRTAAIDDLESAADIDYNDDGMIGGEKVGGKIGDGDVENDPIEKPKDAEDVKRALEAAKATLDSEDLYLGDPDNGPGSKEQPYAFSSMEEFSAWFRETTGQAPVLTSSDYGQYKNQTVFVDQYGNYYTLRR